MNSAARVGTGPSVFVDRPMSRLSIRMTRKPAVDEPVDDVRRPRHELGAEAHDEEHRLAVVGPVHLVLDRHVPELRTGHEVSLAPRRGASAETTRQPVRVGA